MKYEPLSVRASVAERLFYLASKFDGSFSRNEAFAVFKANSVDTCADAFQSLTNSGLVVQVERRKRPKAAQYSVSEKGYQAATKFEKMIERTQRFIKELDE